MAPRPNASDCPHMTGNPGQFRDDRTLWSQGGSEFPSKSRVARCHACCNLKAHLSAQKPGQSSGGNLPAADCPEPDALDLLVAGRAEKLPVRGGWSDVHARHAVETRTIGHFRELT